MPRIVKKEEVLCFEGSALSDFLNKKFLEKIEEKKLDLLPINLIFIATEKEKGKEGMYPIILGHSNREEVKKKMLHISAPKTKLSEKFIKILEEME